MTKLGKQFELVVADVAKALDPHATVRQGKWIDGPDGRRDLDVIVEGTFNGKPRKVQIECKDYDPKRRPVGIALIDALDSKHRDLGMDVSLMCSNAGFTSDAIRKAKRLGIGLIGVLRSNDARIRYKVIDELYIRRAELVPAFSTSIDHASSILLPKGLDGSSFKFKGGYVEDWLRSKSFKFLVANWVVRGTHKLRFRFKFPIEIEYPGGSFFAAALSTTFQVAGSWIVQNIEIDATSGLYNWVRQTVQLGVQGGTIELKKVQFGTGGEPIDIPPDFDPDNLHQPEGAGVRLWVHDLGSIVLRSETLPELDPFVVDEDLEEWHKGLPREFFYSAR